MGSWGVSVGQMRPSLSVLLGVVVGDAIVQSCGECSVLGSVKGSIRVSLDMSSVDKGSEWCEGWVGCKFVCSCSSIWQRDWMVLMS